MISSDVGGLEHVIFSHILRIIIIPIASYFFRGVETTNQNNTLNASPHHIHMEDIIISIWELYYKYISIWVNHNDLTVLPSPGNHWCFFGKPSPLMAELFRLVKYDDLLRTMTMRCNCTRIHIIYMYNNGSAIM